MQIMILGASRSSISLMKRLIEKGHTCVLVDPKAQEIEQQFNLGILTINGIIIDIDVLKEADIASMDMVCAMSESENQNLMASQIARDVFNVSKVFTRVFASEDYHLFDDAGFLSISSTVLTADAFMRAIDGRIKKEEYVGQCMANIFGNSLAFTILDIDESFVGAKVRDVEDTEGRHIFAVVRHDQFITTLPNMKLEKGDKLVLAEKKV
ncbi:MAG: TrkA family potassium uptake protein [Clostridiales bacterium]|nr:TrkA family potassium uptake protein [Clostridiales bacterium]